MAAPDPGTGSSYAPADFSYRKPFGGTVTARGGYKMPFGPTVHGATGSTAKQPPAGQPQPSQDPYGSQSGPGILESWFNQRASGTDPGYEYAMNRGMNDIDSRMAAGGSFNSGARGQQLSDYASSMGAQREGQLDALASGASGEHLGRLGLMFNQGLGVAGGESGLASAYDLGAAGNMAAANQAQQQMYLNKAGVDSQFAQGRINNLINAYAAYNGAGGGKSSSS